MIAKISGFFNNTLGRNILAIYGAEFSNYIVFLALIPYLARVLGPWAWGEVAFYQVFAGYVGIIVEYGFGLSATRKISRYRDNPDELGKVFSEVVCAKGVLALCAFALTLAGQALLPSFGRSPVLIWSSFFWAIIQSFNLFWFFRGLERIKFVAAMILSSNLLTVAGILFFIRAPEDAWKIYLIMGVISSVALFVTLYKALCSVKFRIPSFVSVRMMLAEGWGMFVFRGPVNLYTMGNAFILGCFASPVLVGYYAGVEKIVRQLLRLLLPLNDVLYPRLAVSSDSSGHRRQRIVRVYLLIIGTGSLLAGTLMFVFAPFWVRIIFGPEFSAAVPVLRVFSILPFVIALSNLFGVHCMLPFDLDRPFQRIILAAGIINLALAFALARSYAHIGMAWAVVISEAFIAVSMFVYLKRSGRWF